MPDRPAPNPAAAAARPAHPEQLRAGADARGLPAAIVERLAGLGVALLRLDPQATPPITPLCHAAQAEPLLGEPEVETTLLELARNGGGRRGDLHEPAPGVYLAPLPEPDAARTFGTAPTGTAACCFTLLMLSPERAGGGAAGGAAGGAMAGVTREEARRLLVLAADLVQQHAEVDAREGELHALSLELASSYEELSLLYKLSTSLRVNESPESTLRDACCDLLDTVGLRWLCLSLKPDEARLDSLTERSFAATAQPSAPASIRFASPHTEQLEALAAPLMHRFVDAREPVICDDTAELDIDGLTAQATSLLVVPIRVGDRLVGLLYGADRLDQQLITSVDAKLCHSLAGSLAIFLENHMLFEDAQGMFLGTLQALTSAIDAKDSYTHGHSERVALLARMLADAAGYDPHTCDRVHLSGLVHDVGKIGVPEAVLCKPGRLTTAEFKSIKRHPEIGAGILRGIRQMDDLIPGVLCHHEKFDGTGYPAGRAGSDIPLFGRILGLVDAFDAMSSHRTYRAAMSHTEVLAEIRRCAGTQFDPELAAVFLKLDFAPYFALIAEHEQGHDRRAA